MHSPELQGAISPGRLVTVWTSEDSHGRRRYILDSTGQLISYGQYLASILEVDEQREHRRERYQRDASLRRWARRVKANGNGTKKISP